MTDWRLNAFSSPVMSEREPFPFPPPCRRRDRVWLHVSLLVLTVVTTTLRRCAALLRLHAGLRRPAPSSRRRLRDPSFYLRGLWYSGTVLAILGCHEMGHYVACRYYQRGCLASLLPPRATAADRDTRGVHPDS